MSNKITHSGVITDIGQQRLTVRIVQTAACAICKANGHCTTSESAEKLIDVYMADTDGRRMGEQVTVSTDVRSGFRAVTWGFGFPLALMTGTLVIVMLLTGREAWAALASIGALIPYYISLYLLRHKIRSQLSFYIE